MQRTEFAGPLPPPEMLAAYEHIIPGMPARLLNAWEEEVAHRRWMERHGLNHAIWLSTAGLVCGVAVSLAALGSSVWLIHEGRSVAGLGPLIAAIGGFAWVFISGKRNQETPKDSSPPIEE